MFNLFVNPLEQFDIYKLFIFFTNMAFFNLLLICVVLFFLLKFNSIRLVLKKYNFIGILQLHLLIFINIITNANISLKKAVFYYLYSFISILIIFANISGLIPFSYTITSSFIFTFSTALLLFAIINILAIFKNGFHNFISFFLPNGTPLGITVLLVFIELISYFARLFSLSIRLFANMMAGHTSLKILIGFSYTICITISILSFFSVIPWFLVTIVVGLEILIGILQAYVSLILISIYTNDILIVH